MNGNAYFARTIKLMNEEGAGQTDRQTVLKQPSGYT